MLNQITKTNQTLMVFQTNTTLNFKPELSCMYIEQILTVLQVDHCRTRLIILGKQADFISEHHEVQPSLRFLITTRYILTKSSLVPPDAKQEQNISLIQLFRLSFRRLDQLLAEVPELLCQLLTSRQFARLLHVAVSKVFSCHSLELWVQSSITSSCGSLKNA